MYLKPLVSCAALAMLLSIACSTNDLNRKGEAARTETYDIHRCGLKPMENNDHPAAVATFDLIIKKGRSGPWAQRRG